MAKLVRLWALSAYDAAYLQLALAENAALVTLDARFAHAYDGAVQMNEATRFTGGNSDSKLREMPAHTIA